MNLFISSDVLMILHFIRPLSCRDNNNGRGPWLTFDPIVWVMEEVDGSEGLDLAQVRAELAAKEREALEVIKEDICQWLSNFLKLDITGSSFLATLETGVEICKLVTSIQHAVKAATDKGKTFTVDIPLEPLSFTTKALSGSFHARDNVSNFISWCRQLGVEEAVIFESEGLVLHKDEKRVILCLLDVARFAERVGIPPPQLVRMEREIELLEAEITRENDTISGDDPFTDRKSNTTSQTQLELFTPHQNPASVQIKNATEPSVHTEVPPSSLPMPTLKDSSQRSSDLKVPKRRFSKRLARGNRSQIPVRNDRKQISRKRKRSVDKKEEEEVHLNKRQRYSHSTNEERRGQGHKENEKTACKEQVRESVDEKVMKEMRECTCQNKIEVSNCGNGKFIVKGASGRNLTIYARVSIL